MTVRTGADNEVHKFVQKPLMSISNPPKCGPNTSFNEEIRLKKSSYEGHNMINFTNVA